MNLRWVILVSLCLQNATYTLLRKYSVTVERVSSKEILLVGELIKIVVSGWIIISSNEPSDAQGVGATKLLFLLRHGYKMFILAAIYLVMNVLSFVALEHIGAGEFTVCAQLKILTTAAFSVTILGTQLTPTKWRALVLLVVGCILVASPSFDDSDKSQSDSVSGQVLGYGAVLTEVCLSGFASIYFEKVVKSNTEVVTVWERNFQLAFYSILIYFVLLAYDSHSSETSSASSSSPWSMVTFVVAFLGALGGLLVAATLKYADSILKTLATAGAIVLATVFGHFLLGSLLNLVIMLGSVCTIIAILNYTLDATPHKMQQPASLLMNKERDIEVAGK